MGIQLHIETAALLKLKFTVTLQLVHIYEGSHGEPDFYSYQAICTTPDTGESFYMDAPAPFNTLWIDYNEWGNNKARIEPFIKRYNIPNIQS